LAAHGFENYSRVFHPTIDDGEIIGQIIERFPDENWAIAKISDGIPVSTSNKIAAWEISL
jgi:hypothetical protein